MSLYDELDVKPDATADEIKRAYRKKAREKHPDKGGSSDEFAPIARAYKVLSNPDLRLLYDATGQERRTPIEVEVQNILTQVFNEALASEKDIEVTAFVRGRLETGARKIPELRKELEVRQVKLEAKRGKITSKGINIAHMIIDGELKNIAAQLANLDHQETVNKACLATLDEYSEEWEAPVGPEWQTVDLRRMQFGGQLGDPFGFRR